MKQNSSVNLQVLLVNSEDCEDHYMLSGNKVIWGIPKIASAIETMLTLSKSGATQNTSNQRNQQIELDNKYEVSSHDVKSSK